MHTLTTDKQKRVRLPDAKPGQVFAYESADGQITLREVRTVEPKSPKTKVVRDKHGVLVMSNGRKFTTEQVQKLIQEEFP